MVRSQWSHDAFWYKSIYEVKPLADVINKRHQIKESKPLYMHPAQPGTSPAYFDNLLSECSAG